MSFLTGMDEEMLTLEAALEFIESCGDDADLSSDSLSDAATTAGKASPAATVASTSSDDEKATRRVSPGKNSAALAAKRKPSASTQQQRRRKQEIQSLREQASELEAHLTQLKRRQSRRLGPSIDGDETEGTVETQVSIVGPQRAGPLVKKQKTSSVWMDLATIQYRERQRAELTNRKLKAIWGNQSKLNDALQQILQKRSTFAVSCHVLCVGDTVEVTLNR